MNNRRILRNWAISLMFAMLVAGLSACRSRPPAAPSIPAATRQLILVITPSETAIQGQLWRFSRQPGTQEWQSPGAPVPVVVGKNGLGWGRGLHPRNLDGLPPKKEGDGKSPAGVFALSAVFGWEREHQLPGLKMPYWHVNDVLECVDDAHSEFYNELVYRDEVDSVDWYSSEKMRAVGGPYSLGVFVDHNVSPTVPDSGSCIFLHLWRGPDTPTVGCTAMAPEHLREIVLWLDRAQSPVLVQLTRRLYEAYRTDWRLPPIPG